MGINTIKTKHPHELIITMDGILNGENKNVSTFLSHYIFSNILHSSSELSSAIVVFMSIIYDKLVLD